MGDEGPQVTVYYILGTWYELWSKHGWIQVGDKIYNYSKDGVSAFNVKNFDFRRFDAKFPRGRSGRMTADQFYNWAIRDRSNGFGPFPQYKPLINDCNHFVSAACRKLGFDRPY